MQRKLLFFDIDGTLKSDVTHEYPESTRRALALAKQNGHLLFINTGRPICNLDAELFQMGFDGFLCGCGTFIRLFGRDLLRAELTHEESRAELLRLRACGFECYFEGHEHVFFDAEPTRPELIRHRARWMSKGIIADTDPDDSAFVFSKYHAYRLPDGGTQAFLSGMDARFEPILRRPDVYEVTPKAYSKATAIDFTLERLSADMDDCFVFGDSVNDLPMLTHVRHAVGMRSGDREVLDTAEYITAAPEEGGIEQAFLHYGLI